jgi:hypothetical protein
MKEISKEDLKQHQQQLDIKKYKYKKPFSIIAFSLIKIELFLFMDGDSKF